MDGVRFRNTTTEIDSGIDISTDLSARKSLLIADRTSTDLGLVDLDAMLQDDDESWLYSGYSTSNNTTTSSSSSSDLIAWLQNAAEMLEPRQRKALSEKLDSIARKKPLHDRMDVDGVLSPIRERNYSGASSTSEEQFFDASSDIIDDQHPTPHILLLSPPLSSSTPKADLLSEALRDRQHTPVATPPAPPLSVKPKKSVTVKSPTTDDSNHDKLKVAVDDKMRYSPSFASAAQTHHPDMHDIQMLAEMQEEDLRQALEKLQLQQRQRKSSQGSDKTTNTSQPNGNVRSELNAVKSKQQQQPTRQSLNRTPNIKAKRPVVPTSNLNENNSLQKSLPNLASSRSVDFSSTRDQHRDTTNSDKGSTGDIAARLSPSANITSRPSMLPTPRKTDAGRGRSAIPMPRSAIPTPSSSAIRRDIRMGTGQVARSSVDTAPSSSKRNGAPSAQHQSNSDNPLTSWNEDCF